MAYIKNNVKGYDTACGAVVFEIFMASLTKLAAIHIAAVLS